jgi:hypothetical protein
MNPMMTKTFEHRFVEFIPEALDEGVLYISITYAAALHRCACRCGREVVTPLSPTGWRLTFDGDSVSLYPSIGNWNFPCRSHYWIDRSRVRGAKAWSDREVEQARRKDDEMRARYYHDGTVGDWRHEYGDDTDDES